MLSRRSHSACNRYQSETCRICSAFRSNSRRYAEGFDDGYEIHPASNLLNAMTLAIGRFPENPVDWDGDPSPTDKRLILDRIKGGVSRKLARFCVLQLREKAQPDWQIAYAFRGTGSTFDRRLKIENLYERWVPEPMNEADDMHHIHEFVDSVKRLVVSAIDETRNAIHAEPSSRADIAAE